MNESMQTSESVREMVHIPEIGLVDIISATNTVGCVDPRASVIFLEPRGILREIMRPNPMISRPEHDEGAERSPGASFGKAMTLAAALPTVSPEMAIELVREWEEESEGRIFTLHEDDQSSQKNGQLGCSHIARACQPENEALYGVSSRRVRDMKDYFLEKLGRKETMAEIPVLTGTHKEKGVVIVLSKDKTVRADATAKEFFRFDEVRHDESLHRLSEFLQRKGYGVSAVELLAVAEKQRGATLSLLAPNLPIYIVDLRGEKPVITKRGSVPPVERNIAE